MAERARLLFEYDANNARVWLTWCAGTSHQKGAKVTEALTLAAKNGAALCQLAVGEPFPPASDEGEPPHKRTGAGQAGIRYGARAATSQAWVGTRLEDFDYMAHHDQHGRAWLLTTLSAHHARLERDVATHLGV